MIIRKSLDYLVGIKRKNNKKMRSKFNIALQSSAAIVVLSAQSKAIDDDGKCRALVMSGGGNNGIWEAGVLYGLLHGGNPQDF